MSSNGDDVSVPFPPSVGYVYAVVNRRAWPGLVKIGRTGSVGARIANYQTGDPHRGYRLIAHSDPTTDVEQLEKRAHTHFKSSRVDPNPKCEWFRVSEAQAIAYLNTLRRVPQAPKAYVPEQEPDDWYADGEG